MKGIIVTIALVVPLLLSACATSPTPASEAKAVPTERVLAFQTQPGGESGTLIVSRDTGFFGGGISITIAVNGTKAAILKTGESVTLYLPAGESIVSASYWTGDLKEREVTLRPGQTKRYRVSFDGANSMDLSPTNF
ncbi:hypothetical protein [Paraburkholderia sediminicola]|uniref:hypothetical protein n=1 Tax=Paraburkholderia sediminicola TaxID=458836 RepID=UPI0038B7377E